MPEQDWFTGLDDARPLPPALRERLQEALLSPQPRELAPELSARLTAQLGDPVADLLQGLDDPLPLRPTDRSRLFAELAVSSAVRAWWLSGAAAAAVAACLAVLVLLPGKQGPNDPTTALPSPTAVATPPATAAPSRPVPGAVGPGGPVVPAAGSSAIPRATRPPTAEPAAPAPQAVREPTIGFYVPSSDGGSLPRTDGTASPSPTPTPAPRPVPNVSARKPDAGPPSGGTLVRLYGYRLQAAVGVWFGTIRGNDFRRLDAKHLTVVSPPHSPANVPLVVRFSDGGQFVIRNGFAFVAPPRLDSTSPSSGSPAGGEWLVLSGAALSRVSAVRFDGTPARSVQVVSDTTLRVLTPEHPIGRVEITATSPGGTSAGLPFTYLV